MTATPTPPAAAQRGDGRTDAQAVTLLREHLAERGGKAEERTEIIPLFGDASTRRYFRLRDRDLTAIAALYPEPFDPERMPFLEVRALLDGYGLPVPEVRHVDAARGLLVLEDLGDLTLQEALPGATARGREDLYREALDQLARLHREAAKGPTRAACFQVAFDIEKLSWELHYFLKHFVEGWRGVDLTAEDRATLGEAVHRLCEEIASWPRVLCHRDFHSRNLMRHADALYWIDFQDARLGPATYDLASLLRDSYVDCDEEFLAERAEEFRQRTLPGESRETFARRYELTCVQRNLKALGTFGYMATVRDNPVYLQYVPRTLTHARRNLLRHPELSGLHRVLAA
ncbi:MAG TPA: phosphotransferase, partial [Vicinamibacteria bacterium]|nr:phosphotransferase [Vicinamibacteria bacterium]